MEVIHHGFGIVEYVDAIKFDSDFFEAWLARRRMQEPSDYEPVGDGTYMNRGGYIFTEEQVNASPGRLLQLKVDASDEDVVFAEGLENAMTMCVSKYFDFFPEARHSIWWRAVPHVATYVKGGYMGYHHDNLVGDGYESEKAIYSVLTGSLILKDDCEGGDLGFKYIDKHFKPKTGSAFVYPAGFLGTHEVVPVTSGERVSYLEFFGHGTLVGTIPFTPLSTE